MTADSSSGSGESTRGTVPPDPPPHPNDIYPHDFMFGLTALFTGISGKPDLSLVLESIANNESPEPLATALLWDRMRPAVLAYLEWWEQTKRSET